MTSAHRKLLSLDGSFSRDRRRFRDVIGIGSPVLGHVRADHVRLHLVLHAAHSSNQPQKRKQSIRPIHISQQLLDPSTSP